jgi:hypothetical protein
MTAILSFLKPKRKELAMKKAMPMLVLFFAGLALFSGISVILGESFLRTFLPEKWLSDIKLVNLVLCAIFLVAYRVSTSLINMEVVKVKSQSK